LRDAGAPIERIALIGGGSRSRFWGEIIATVIGQSLHLPVGAELGPALGAARLARQAVGGNLLDQAARSDLAVIAPIPNWADSYQQRRSRYRAHYPALSRNLPAATVSQK
jgi:xylulokinase